MMLKATGSLVLFVLSSTVAFAASDSLLPPSIPATCFNSTAADANKTMSFTLVGQQIHDFCEQHNNTVVDEDNWVIRNSTGYGSQGAITLQIYHRRNLDKNGTNYSPCRYPVLESKYNYDCSNVFNDLWKQCKLIECIRSVMVTGSTNNDRFERRFEVLHVWRATVLP